MRRSGRSRTTIPPPCILRSPAHPAQAWSAQARSPPEEPSRSHLDEWFLPGCHQAPCQRASPDVPEVFFPEVHDEITKSWFAPYLSRLLVSSTSTFTSVDGAEEKGYNILPPLDESVAACFCPPLARRQKPPTRPNCVERLSALAGQTYSSAGQASNPSLNPTCNVSTSCPVRLTWPCAAPR